MRCPSCEFENPEGMNFCGKCGAKLSLLCPHCDFENPPGFQFCGKCGASLTPPPGSTSTQVDDQKPDQLIQVESLPTEPHTPEAERRQLTVMFVDMVGSTELSGQLDPEDYRAVVREYQKTCTEVIERYDGYVAQYLGDGLLVYFGYPQSHEDEAQRAVYTGLGILDAMKHLNSRLESDKDIRLGVRVGVHTGLVVVGEIGEGSRQEQLALGEVPNIAARIQGLAEPDTIVISDATYRLTQGYFECQELGEQTFRGVAEPMRVYRVLQESGAQGRLDIARTRGLTPLVGREQEVGILLDRWAQVKDGQGQIVLLSGEAGIGKSRIVQTLKDHVTDEAPTLLECRSSPYFTNSALYPIIDMVQRTLRFQTDDTSDQKLAKLEQHLSQYRLSMEETVPLLASLLSLPVPEDRYPPLNLSPQRQRQKTLESIVTIILELAERQPLLFILEDAHWQDPSTHELLDLLINQTPTACLLLLVTYRPEFQPQWGNRSYLTQVTLNRLSRSQIESIATQVAGGKTLPSGVIKQLVERTDGVPLYVEEMTKAVLESGSLKEANGHYELSGSLSTLVVPSTLQDSLMARLDRLVTAKGVAQQAAVIGRQFSYGLLKAVSQLDDIVLERELELLVDAELIYQRGIPPQSTYQFKHALVTDIAYQSLLRSTRQQYHQRIVQTLEEWFPETTESQPELLAHHYTESGLNEQAVPYWQQAGQRANERSAHAEAVAHLTTGLAVLKMLPETPQRTQHELMLYRNLGPALMATKGVAAPEVEHAYARARELCQQVEDTSGLFPVLAGLHRFYFAGGMLQTAQELGEQLLGQAQRQSDAALLLSAHWMLGTPLVWLGEVASAHEHFEQSIALYDAEQHRSLAVHFGFDPGASCRAYAAYPLWALGYPDRALKRSQEALALAQQLSHLFSLGYVLGISTIIHHFRREVQVAQERAEATIALSTDHGFPVWLALGTFYKGWALTAQDQSDEGITQMREGLASWQATGMGVNVPLCQVLLAEAYGRAGKIEEGLAVLAEAVDAIANTGERFYEAELYRVKGLLLLALCRDDRVEAESCFHQALFVARRQQAKSLELRAATSLARLWHQEGKGDEARELLAPVYEWFTEGFDTADLQEAKVLLVELSE